MIGGQFVVRQGIAYPLDSGACLAAEDKGPFWRHAGRLGDEVLLWGGTPFFYDQNELPRKRAGVSAVQFGKKTAGRTPAANLCGPTNGFAAWDDRHMIALPFIGEHAVKAPRTGLAAVPDVLVAWSRNDLDAYLQGEFAKDPRKIQAAPESKKGGGTGAADVVTLPPKPGAWRGTGSSPARSRATPPWLPAANPIRQKTARKRPGGDGRATAGLSPR